MFTTTLEVSVEDRMEKTWKVVVGGGVPVNKQEGNNSAEINHRNHSWAAVQFIWQI